VSRKRKQRKAEAVPEEVLAEGSGPVATETPVEAVEAPVHVEAVESPDDALEAVEAPDLSEVEAVEVIDLAEASDLAGDPTIDTTEAEVTATLPTSAASMDAGQLKLLVEALVFAADKPITIARLRQLTRVSDTRRLEQALAELTEDYTARGLVLQQVSGGYQFRTRTQFSGWVQQLIAGRPVRLSRAQLETLAIIAYRQPITRPEIDDIRGVDSSGTLKVLIDRALIRILGKKEEVGRPMLYGTTKEFLDFFSLSDLRELPTLREYSELTDESRKVMTDRLGIAPDGGDDGGGSEGGGMGGMGGMGGEGSASGHADDSLGASGDDELKITDAELEAASASFEAVEASTVVADDTTEDVEPVASGDIDTADVEALEAPDVEAPDVEAADVEAADVEAVGVEAVGVEAVGVEAVDVEAVGVEAVGVEAVGVEAVGVEAVGVEAVGVEAVGVEAVVVEAVDVEAVDVEAVDVEAVDVEAVDVEAAAADDPSSDDSLLAEGSGPFVAASDDARIDDPMSEAELAELASVLAPDEVSEATADPAATD
jgi:segregation and condensation protein B